MTTEKKEFAQYTDIDDVIETGRHAGKTFRELVEAGKITYISESIRKQLLNVSDGLYAECRELHIKNWLATKNENTGSHSRQMAAIAASYSNHTRRILQTRFESEADCKADECIHERCWLASNGCRHKFRNKCNGVF